MRNIATLTFFISLVGCSSLITAHRPKHQALVNYCSTKIEKNPTDVKAYAARAKAYEQDNQLAKAAADYAKWIELAPNEAAAYAGRARCNFYSVSQGGNWAGLSATLAPVDPLHIQADLDRCIALDPTYDKGSALFLRGGIRLIQFRDDDANADFAAFLQQNPTMAKEVEATAANWRKQRNAAPIQNTLPVRGG